ncbi:hypothetical protein IscW_ISCW003262 [Ixodes scapularis]|uniref:Secreted protein n=1 Tax=Ixodes scapularis TaxID=6945 RepID=B7PAP6_IXOSC|nr:hypothetical protein IscW_ISCW003262 [Ixodes scapularis]|eukprot:XP_002407096.1 hypothetical protein IscW_ISCW003262 [Ixodes scapularis]
MFRSQTLLLAVVLCLWPELDHQLFSFISNFDIHSFFLFLGLTLFPSRSNSCMLHKTTQMTMPLFFFFLNRTFVCACVFRLLYAIVQVTPARPDTKSPCAPSQESSVTLLKFGPDRSIV